ncbi:hypothetical protein [Pedobacter sandarakinus]|uniref:hypothetical protein n=1 Tax=Pedobacter sandarakinus TaxID=353156 RepID=UPI002245968A|nr:hypothetical protein [Pedobacter sandarakinus]MCX2574536.1 hypothetical protein [Pedobacter sandarakinus]
MNNQKAISNKIPPLQSMQFDRLREIGLAHIQQLSKGIWTDFNLHDPGITTLEALCYAITDLGYRLTFDLQDLLASNPDDGEVPIDLKNFFTARQILHSAPVTTKDFRKLLMDVSIIKGEETLGIKNAWVKPSDTAEQKLFINHQQDKLSYLPTTTDNNGFYVRGLYNFVLEFDHSTVFGDLNSNTLNGVYVTKEATDQQLDGVEVKIDVRFSRWDDLSIDLDEDDQIIANIKSIEIRFDELPSGYQLKANYDSNWKVSLSGTRTIAGVLVALNGLSSLNNQINDFIFKEVNGILQRYKQKISLVKEIVTLAEARLNQHRPLCEDYHLTKALKIEEIAICGNIEIDPFADASLVAAKIYFEIYKFLSPSVLFYSLPEMQAKHKAIEDIFAGPALLHGFIDDDELDASEQRCAIRSSDLIQIIMDVELEGRKVVKSISGLQLANFPEDNISNIDQRSVKWCLELATNQFYIPRLSPTLSNLSFYKSALPIAFDEDAMMLEYNRFISQARKRYPINPVLDIPIPTGDWREITSYTSIQEDFPQVYGIGANGIPNLPVDADERTERIVSAKQFKGFLCFFDQLLYGYLQQINGLKLLFSMSQEEDEYGETRLNKTYFNASLINGNNEIVPSAVEQHIFKTDYDAHLSNITEDKTTFENRRNRFLDHMLARFCEQFSDYALIAYTLDGQKAGVELIKDKLSFLNSYPEISNNRGKAFNYKTELSWHAQNVSGYEKRVALLLGINPLKGDGLHFSKAFRILPVSGVYRIESKVGAKLYLENIKPIATRTDAKLLLEKWISAGIHEKNYRILKHSSTHKFSVYLVADHFTDDVIAQSHYDGLTAGAAKSFVKAHIELCLNELCEKQGSSRRNLALPILDYFEILTHTVDHSSRPYLHKIKYQLFDKPIADSTGKVVLVGDVEGPEVLGNDDAESMHHTAISLFWKVIRYASDADYYRYNPENTLTYQANYHFEIVDHYGNTIAKDSDKNYNKPLADILENSTYKPIFKIVDSQDNNGTYTIKNTVAIGPNIKVEIDETFPSNAPNGKCVFSETLPVQVDQSGRRIMVGDLNLNARINVGDDIKILYDEYSVEIKVYKLTYINNEWMLITSTQIPPGTATLVLRKVFPIKSINPKSIIIKAGGEKVAVENRVNFFNKTFINGEGIHLVEHLLLRPRVSGVDRLMNIHTDVDCEQCKIADTYSFVMTAVLPYWPDRFRDRNFRAFIEKTLRQEAPAHIAMNICWVSPLQMYQFEKAYKLWLIQVNMINNDNEERAKAMEALIVIIQELRSVYPAGKLHSCKENEQQKNTLVLNQTNIGIF